MNEQNFQSVKDDAINLLIVDASLSRADEYTTVLRNAGLATHPTQITSPTQFSDYLKNKTTDVILYSYTSNDEHIGDILDIFESSNSQASLIIVTYDVETTSLIDTMHRGVRDIINSQQPLHLELVIKREYQDIRLRDAYAQLKKQYNESEHRCGALIESSRDAIAYVHEGMHVHANPVYLELFGYLDEDDMLGMTLLDLVAPEHLAQMKKLLRKQLTSDSSASIEIQCKNVNDEIFDAELEFTPAIIDGEPATQIIIRDQSIQKELDKKLQQLDDQISNTTAFVNQEGFLTQTDDYFADQESAADDNIIAYLMLNNSEEMKQKVGLKDTEKIIQHIAEIIDSSVIPHCTCTRIGDFSFGLLIKHTQASQVEPALEELLSNIKNSAYTEAAEFITPSASIGIVKCKEVQVEHGHEYINMAYTALQSIQESNEDTHIGYYDHSQYQEADTEISEGDNNIQLVALIKQALENDGFTLVYQPIVSLQGDTRENYAVMIRLPKGNNTELHPDDFFPAAESAGLMSKIDRWVIKNAVHELAIQRRDGRKINFFINISEKGLQDTELLLWVCDCLRDNQAKGPWLTFQIKDHAVRSHIQDAKVLIEGLRKIRCQIALDHFGRVQQSSSLLKHIDVDFVKLAPEFMDELATSPENQTALAEANNLIHSFNLKSIATGVEDANSLALLWTSGVNYIQGYFLQEPTESITYDFDS